MRLRKRPRVGSTGRPIHPGVRPKRQSRAHRIGRASVVLAALLVVGMAATALAQAFSVNASPQCDDGPLKSKTLSALAGVNLAGEAGNDDVGNVACANKLTSWLDSAISHIEGLITIQDSTKSDYEAWKGYYEAYETQLETAKQTALTASANARKIDTANTKLATIKSKREGLDDSTTAARDTKAAAQGKRDDVDTLKTWLEDNTGTCAVAEHKTRTTCEAASSTWTAGTVPDPTTAAPTGKGQDPTT